MNETGWAWFEPGDGEMPTGADGELLTIAGRWLSGPDADRMLAHLRAITLERTLGPAAPARALRHLEGQRALVVYLDALRARAKAT